MDIAQQLKTNGFVIIHLYNRSEIKNYIKLFKKCCESFREFKKKPFKSDIYIDNKLHCRYTLCKYGFMNNPSSFHCKFSRELRANMYMKIFNILATYANMTYAEKSKVYLTQLFDRMCLRIKDSEISSSQWHRDITNTNSVDGLLGIIGGWLSLTDDQYLTFIPNTQLEPTQNIMVNGYVPVTNITVPTI